MAITYHKLAIPITAMAVVISALAGSAAALGTVTSCNETGFPKDAFGPGENVYVMATGLNASTWYMIWIQDYPVNDGDVLDPGEEPSGAGEFVYTDGSGNLPVTEIWTNINGTLELKTYDIVVDEGPTTSGCDFGNYNQTIDGLDNTTIIGAPGGFIAPIPELPSFALADIGAMVGLIALGRRKDGFSPISSLFSFFRIQTSC